MSNQYSQRGLCWDWLSIATAAGANTKDMKSEALKGGVGRLLLPFLVKTKKAAFAYRGHLIHHVWHEGEASHEGARGHEGSRHLDPHLARNVAEGLQLLRVLAHALHVGVAELVLDVDQPEHPLQEVGPEVRQHGFQVDGGAAGDVVAGQRGEELREQLGVLYVHLAVGPHEHVVQWRLGVFQELLEELCGEKKNAP